MKTDLLVSNDAAWEEFVEKCAPALRYPATPGIAARWQHDRDASRGARPRVLRPILVGGAIAALLCVVLLASPLRANLLDWLRIGSISIRLGEEQVALPTNPAAANELGDLLFYLGGATTLQQAAQNAEIPVMRPTLLPEPDRVFLERIGAGDVVTMLWLANDEDIPAAVLQAIARESWAVKMMPQVVENVMVSGTPALWTTGPYWLLSPAGENVERRLVVNHTLIWQEGDVTWRFESALPLADAVRVAESLEPVDTGRR